MSKSILETVHESMQGLHDAGIVTPTTMRKFDELCVTPPNEMSKTEIKKIRLNQKVSLPVFVQYLGVSASTVKKWENGEKKPSKMALRFLHTVSEKGLSVIAIKREN